MPKKNKPEEELGYPQIVERRFNQVRFVMEDLKVDALVVTYLPNIRYLTNFSGSNATLLVMPDKLHFFTDDRYEEQIKTELYPLSNVTNHITRSVWDLINEKKIMKGISTLGFEADRIAYSDAVDIRNKIRPVKFKPAPGAIEPFTMPKAPEELEYIKQACQMAEKVYEKILNTIKPGMTEKELATEIVYQSRMMGSEGEPFDTIAVSGERTALVHGQPSDKKIKKNEVVLIDFGCKVNGFGSDITRTFVMGKATKEQQNVYKLLVEAKNEAIENMFPGTNGKIVDSIARSKIEKAGFGDNFQHSLGHGIGLVPHEKPIITFRMEDQIVPEDCVVAIEPGVYFPGKWGMRVEDNVHVTRNESVFLTTAPEELVVV